MSGGSNRGGESEDENVQLSDAQLDAIAERATAKIVAAVQLEIGKSALRALGYVAWAAVVAAVAWLVAHGYMKA